MCHFMFHLQISALPKVLVAFYEQEGDINN